MATVENWIEDLLDRAQHSATESSRIAMNSYGAGYDRGYAEALQVVFANLPKTIAQAEMLDGEASGLSPDR